MTGWLERQRNILDLALAMLLRRRWQNLGRLALQTACVGMIASVLFFTGAMRREASLLLAGAPDLVVQRLIGGHHEPIPLAYLEEIRRTTGVAVVRPRLWGYYFDPVTGANYTVLTTDDHGPSPGSVSIGAGIARTRGATVGDLFPLTGFDGLPRVFAIEEVFAPAGDLLTVDLLLMQSADFREFYNLPNDLATDLAVTLNKPGDVVQVASLIRARHPEVRTISRQEMVGSQAAIFDWRGGMFQFIVLAMALALAILVWDRANGLSDLDRREIGTLRAVGWQVTDILALRFWEGMLVALGGFLLGVLGAYGHVFLVTAPLFTPLLQGWGVLYPEFRITPAIDPLQMAILFTLTVVPYLVATVVPSWRAASGGESMA